MVMFCTSNVFSQEHFRQVTWGMNVKTVMAQESQKLSIQEKNRLEYNCVLADIPGKIIYVFSKSGQLKRGKYYLTPQYYNMDYYIQDFKMFESMLTNKYGKVSKRMVVTSSENQDITENDWPLLLLKGALRVELIWNSTDTVASLILSKGGMKPTIQIDYNSVEFGKVDLADKKTELMNEI
jgi:hypothetical protein